MPGSVSCTAGTCLCHGSQQSQAGASPSASPGPVTSPSASPGPGALAVSSASQTAWDSPLPLSSALFPVGKSRAGEARCLPPWAGDRWPTLSIYLSLRRDIYESSSSGIALTAQVWRSGTLITLLGGVQANWKHRSPLIHGHFGSAPGIKWSNHFSVFPENGNPLLVLTHAFSLSDCPKCVSLLNSIQSLAVRILKCYLLWVEICKISLRADLQMLIQE